MCGGGGEDEEFGRGGTSVIGTAKVNRGVDMKEKERSIDAMESSRWVMKRSWRGKGREGQEGGMCSAEAPGGGALHVWLDSLYLPTQMCLLSVAYT